MSAIITNIKMWWENMGGKVCEPSFTFLSVCAFKALNFWLEHVVALSVLLAE